MTAPQPILIAGGGIGGLATAIALDRQNIEAQILERSTFAEESGAGIQLGPNVTRILRHVGVLDTLAAQTSRPQAIWLFDGRNGKKLATVPLGNVAERRYGAPYLTLHRTDLHQALRTVASSLPRITLTAGVAVTQIRGDNGVSVTDSDGETHHGSALIGADGLWSTVRDWIAPGLRPAYAGATAYRSLIPRDSLPEPFSSFIVGLWLGPRSHLVHYPVQGGSAINIVAVAETGQAGEGWNRSAERETVLSSFERWNKVPLDLIEAAPQWRAWSLFALRPLPQWSRGAAVLLGDAAHPVLPYLAQGAGLAIEDAAKLAELVGASRAEPSAAFSTYETLRRPRAAQVQRAARRLGRAYHLGGTVFGDLIRFPRNLILGLRGQDATLRGFDWLYGWPSPERQ
ncbi:MAG: FAD-dependent monooxygenase [Methyloceanibacter sp.]|jgi:salicylate hydroxylase